jgi:predicted RNA-binding Zn ribbon-like protein
MAQPVRFFDLDPALPFKYIGGDPSIDLVNTVDWTDTGLVDERLVSYDGLTRWAEGAGVLSAAEADVLRERAARRDVEAAAALVEAHQLRLVLQRVFTGVARGSVPEDALAELNARLAAALAHLRVEPPRTVDGVGALAWGWRGWGEALDGVLWPVTWAAARLLVSDDRVRVRVCDGPRCGWAYVDRSRNGLRRWCQTGVCGARAKARRHYARKRGAVDASRSEAP